MSSSEHQEPSSESPPEAAAADQVEAQRAADGLKSQIASIRTRIAEARKALEEHARREGEQRSFKR